MPGTDQGATAVEAAGDERQAAGDERQAGGGGVETGWRPGSKPDLYLTGLLCTVVG